MNMSFLYLCLQTIALWAIVILLHRQRNKYTLIPLYSFIAVLTLFTHHLSDLGFAVTVNNIYFLISSFSFFTSLMLGILFIYLFEGPRATRLALMTILGSSFFYIGIVALLGLQTDTSQWIALSASRLVYYFWSISAIIIDIFFIAIFWEILKKLHAIPFVFRIFLVIFGTYILDTLIFATGVFGGQSMYLSVLEGNLIIRLILALVVTPIAAYFMKKEGYMEGDKSENRSVWAILNFKSDLEAKIQTMEEALKVQADLEGKLKESREQYQLAFEGANAGIWDWNTVSGHIQFSPRFCALLGFEKNELPNTIDEFKKLIHPDDVESTFAAITDCFKTQKILSLEYRLQNKDKSYKWYLKGGIVQYSSEGKPIRMVGSIIDIDEKKQLINSYKEKAEELEQLNRLMVGREIQMIELKEEVARLKNTATS